MKQFALVLFVAAVSASESEHGSVFTYPRRPSYQQPSHHHHAPKSGSYAPVHIQTKGYQSTPQQYGHGYAAPNYSRGSYYHQPNHSHNPFDYSRPQIPYVAAKLSAPIYATCYGALSDSGIFYSVKFG